MFRYELIIRDIVRAILLFCFCCCQSKILCFYLFFLLRETHIAQVLVYHPKKLLQLKQGSLALSVCIQTITLSAAAIAVASATQLNSANRIKQKT